MVQVPVTSKRSVWFHAEGTGKSVHKMKGFSKLAFLIYPSSKDSLFNTELLHANGM